MVEIYVVGSSGNPGLLGGGCLFLLQSAPSQVVVVAIKAQARKCD